MPIRPMLKQDGTLSSSKPKSALLISAISSRLVTAIFVSLQTDDGTTKKTASSSHPFLSRTASSVTRPTMSTTLARRLPTALALPSRSLVRHARPIQSRLQSTARAVSTEPTTSPLSLPPPRKKGGSWRGTFLRWGAAGGAVWWYMTSPVFAEEPERMLVLSDEQKELLFGAHRD